MRIMGVDPGLVTTGAGIIEAGGSGCQTLSGPGGEFRFLYSDAIKPPPGDLPLRLLYLHDHLAELISRFDCRAVAVEDQFYGVNAQTAFKTGQARGAALLAAARCGVPVTLYPPARIKQAVVGTGRASKEQVQRLVMQILNVASLPAALDCSDALAVALCHGFTTGSALALLTATRSRRR